MKIQIDNGGFTNKGGELMMFAAMQQLKKALPVNPTFFVQDAGFGIDQIHEAGMKPLLYKHKFGVALDRLLPKPIKKIGPFYNRNNIDVLLDISGFRIGDQWIAKNYHPKTPFWMEKYYSQYKSNGTKLIFLPQAFGPFTDKRAKAEVEIVAKYADIIFAREQQSYDYIINEVGAEKVMLAPDFTNLSEGYIYTKQLKEVGDKVCLVVNYKMVNKTAKEIAENYIDYFVQLVKRLEEAGIGYFFLNHEGAEDRKLIDKIVASSGSQANILDNLHSLNVKGIISASKLLISSRFHGVVSGLSQGVPTLCTSWSHKYPLLLSDYNFSEGLLTMNISEDWTKIQQLLEPDQYFNHVQHLVGEATKQKERTVQMWERVYKEISESR